MIQFLAPFWLFTLPLSVLPWFFPVFRKPQQQPYLFSAFILLPEPTLRKRFLFSLEDFLLKLLRSLIMILVCLILARPFWQEEGEVFTIWVFDDTFSLTLSSHQETLSALQDLAPLIRNQPTWKLSELFVKSPHLPVGPTDDKWQDITTASPNLSEIGNLILKKLGNVQDIPNLRVNLVSDFQRTQYQFYESAPSNIEWIFHRPAGLKTLANLSLRMPQLENTGLFDFKLTGEIYGEFPANRSIQVKIVQNGQTIGTQKIIWQGEGTQKLEILLQKAFQRHHPLEIILQEEEGNVLDNTRFFQWHQAKNFWVSIVTSEGNSGIYRHGLHQLKSALNANQIFAFLSATHQDLEHHKPDVLLLLGDHPIRWAETLKDYPSKLFIPTRLGDWKTIATQNDSSSPQGLRSQWFVDWRKAEFAEEWKIQKVNEYLYYSPVWNLWFLATGVSPRWGSLYQDVVFADQVQAWLITLIEKAPDQYLGTLDLGNSSLKKIAPDALTYQWIPGHYQILNPAEEKTYHFSVNLPSQESTLDWLTDAQLEKMQQHFEQQTQHLEKQSAVPAVNQLREWLLWGLWGLLLLEILYVMIRLFKKNWQGYGKYSFD